MIILFQSWEKELNRQLRREKDKCQGLKKQLKDARDDNDKLRVSIPFDEAALLSPRAGYDIPYGIHGTQRLESRRVSIQGGMKCKQSFDILKEILEACCLDHILFLSWLLISSSSWESSILAMLLTLLKAM